MPDRLKVKKMRASLVENQEDVARAWESGQRSDPRIRGHLFDGATLARESRAFVDVLVRSLEHVTDLADAEQHALEPVRVFLHGFASAREREGFTPFETAAAIICFKDFWLPHLQATFTDPHDARDAVVATSQLVDTLALLTLEDIVRRREDVISMQAREILEISIPVVQLWEGVVAAVIVGPVDSARARQLNDVLLERVSQTDCRVALVDITGVPIVDSTTANHLMQTFAALRLLGVEGVLTGMRPSIAATLVHLGADLLECVTKPTMEAGLRYALGADAPSRRKT